MRLYALACACSVYRFLRKYDIAYDKFLDKTKPYLDMHNSEHRKALLKWLREWGCRQFKNTFDKEASNNLESWYTKNESLLPSPSMSLLEISDIELKHIVDAYNTLREEKASDTKTVGPTGASKILFAFREEICPPWDGAMRKKWGYSGNAESYNKFLEDTKNTLVQLKGECSRHGFTLNELPGRLGRQQSSLIKLLDEYNFVVITNAFRIPHIETIQEWYYWAQ